MTKAQTKEEIIDNYIEKLGCSLYEAEQLYNYDNAVEHGEKTEFDLKGEKKKVSREFTRTGTRKTPVSYNFAKRDRKPNATKGGLVSELAKFLETGSEFSTVNVTITNKERQIAFTIGEDNFELTLVQKRKPKQK